MFETLNHAAVPSHGEIHEDQLAQILVDILDKVQQAENEDSEREYDGRGIDLMASNNEKDEEETESENKRNHTFLSDKGNKNEPAFYRRLNVELATTRRQERMEVLVTCVICVEDFDLKKTSLLWTVAPFKYII